MTDGTRILAMAVAVIIVAAVATQREPAPADSPAPAPGNLADADDADTAAIKRRLSEQIIIAERKAAEIRAELDRRCRDDPSCLAEKIWLDAHAECQDRIERLAKYQVEWLTGWTVPMFSETRWNAEKRHFIYRGDAVQFQNGFGAWQRQNYICTFDPATMEVVSVGAIPGRL